MVGLSMMAYLKNVCLNVLAVTILTVIPTYAIYKLIPDMGWLQFIAVGTTSVVSSILSILYAGCTSNERQFFIAKACALKDRIV